MIKQFRIAFPIALLLIAANFALAREILPLSGTWEIVFDHKHEGREASWYLDQAFSEHPAKRDIRVPSCWEEIEKDDEGVAYYRHKFRVPADWDGKTIRLHFDAVNFMAEVWLNDRAVGFHEGGFAPFEFVLGMSMPSVARASRSRP